MQSPMLPPPPRVPEFVPVRRVDRLLAARIFREEGKRERFTRIGIARATEPARYDRFRDWVSAGHHAGMAYLANTAVVRGAPDRLLPDARSIICLAAPHRTRPWVARDGSRVARYATDPGSDYHWTLRERATRVAERTAERVGSTFGYRVCVDSTPLCERSFAAAAGLGWIGKNGCLIDPEQGSFLLLAEILTDLDLPPDDPIAERCGACVRCLDACPTQAFVEPGVLDSRRCLAYWTIEHRGPIPDVVKERLGEHVFGCDVCQEVCPWNAPLLPVADDGPPDRADWLAMGRGEWRRRFAATPLNRAGRRGLQRNAAASAGSSRDAAAVPALRRVAGVAEPGLADAARWALARLKS